MNKTVKTILISGIYAFGYWGYVFIFGAVYDDIRVIGDFLNLLGGPIVIVPGTYAVITVIILYYRKCFEKIIHIIIFVLTSILFNLVILWFQCTFLYVDGLGVVYAFEASIVATIISTVLYMILYIIWKRKAE